MNLNDYKTTLNGQPVVYSDPIDSLFPDTRSKLSEKERPKGILQTEKKNAWKFYNRSEELKVYAWKDITPPKEIKENEN